MLHKVNGLRFYPDAGDGDGSGDGAGDGDGGAGEEEGEEELTPEEIKEMRAENTRLKATMAKSRTEKAREAKAAKDAAAKEDGDSAVLQKQLDEERAERAALETKLQRQAATSIAATLGAVDPDAAVVLLDWDTLVDPGNPDEVKQAMRQLLKEKPFLRKATKDVDAGAGGGGNTGTSFNDIIRNAAGR